MAYQKKFILFPTAGNSLFITEFCRSFSDCPRNAIPQMRNGYMLHIVTEGVAKFGDFEARRGDAFLIPKNVLYSFQLSAGFHLYWFGFNGDGADGLLHAFNFPTNQILHFRVDDVAKTEAFLQAQHEALAESKNTQNALSALLYCLPALRPYQQSPRSDYVQQAKQFIDANYPYEISLETVADSVHISEKYLCKLFKKYLGISPQQYLIQTRMLHAKELLLNTNILIKEVAANVGFSSQFFFASTYKKYYGITPTEQRQRRRGGENS